MKCFIGTVPNSAVVSPDQVPEIDAPFYSPCKIEKWGLRLDSRLLDDLLHRLRLQLRRLPMGRNQIVHKKLGGFVRRAPPKN